MQDLPEISRVFIVTDEDMVKFGYAKRVLDQLNLRRNEVKFKLFDQVQREPTTDIVDDGVKMMREFKPDTIIALGGGSVMDAAKGMWMFYEHPKHRGMVFSRSTWIFGSVLTRLSGQRRFNILVFQRPPGLVQKPPVLLSLLTPRHTLSIH